jgi:sialate O-acetylesterase
MLYTEKMRALIQGWRTVWGQGVFPFYYVQIAPFQYGEEAPEIMAEFWEAQTAALEIPETGMVVVSDIGDLQDIHPKNKTDVAKRLALIALAKEYGREGIVYSGPHFQRMETDGRSLRLYFDHVGTGLASRDGEALDNFEIGGENGYFVPAEARIDGDTVLVSSPEVEAPTAVRFAWHKLATPNLMNREGLPALPFRSGTLPTRAILDKLLPELADWELLYSVDAPTQADDAITYEEDHHQEVNGTIDRVGYFLMLQKGETEPQYVFVTMSPFSDDPAMLGVPTAASGAVFQQRVGTIGVRSNVPGITTGEEAGEGYIEFWPHNYGPTNSAGVPGASNAVYDWGDTYSDPVKGYGSMQVHNLSAPQVVFAFNNWRSGASGDAGIGTSTGEQKDWTFSRNVGSYKTVKLQVLVKYAE